MSFVKALGLVFPFCCQTLGKSTQAFFVWMFPAKPWVWVGFTIYFWHHGAAKCWEINPDPTDTLGSGTIRLLLPMLRFASTRESRLAFQTIALDMYPCVMFSNLSWQNIEVLQSHNTQKMGHVPLLFLVSHSIFIGWFFLLAFQLPTKNQTVT